MVKVVKAVEALGLKGHGLSSLPVRPPYRQISFTSRWVSQPGSTALPEGNRYETKFGGHCEGAKGVTNTSVSEARRRA